MYAVISNPDWHPCHEKYKRERQIAVYILTTVLISLVFFPNFLACVVKWENI